MASALTKASNPLRHFDLMICSNGLDKGLSSVRPTYRGLAAVTTCDTASAAACGNDDNYHRAPARSAPVQNLTFAAGEPPRRAPALAATRWDARPPTSARELEDARRQCQRHQN